MNRKREQNQTSECGKESEKRSLVFWHRFFRILLVLSLLPIAWISLYNHASADDFAFSNYPHHGWLESGFVGFVQGIVQQLHWSYTSWQGGFTAVILGSLNPVAFGDAWYGLVAFLLIGFLILSVWIFWRTLLGDERKKHSCGCGGTAACILSMAMIQLIPRALDMFFWWDGAVNYLPFYGMLLILSALLIQNLRRGLRIHQVIFGAVLSFFAMGGNYVTALVNLLVLLFFGILPILTQFETQDGMPCCCGSPSKEDAGSESRGSGWNGKAWLPGYLVILLCGCVGLAVSVLAPGNQLRMDAEGAEGITSIPNLVIHSLYLAYESVRDNMSILLVLFLLLLLPFFRHSYSESAEVPHRWLHLPTAFVIVLLFGIYAASFAPSVYVYGDGGPMRIEDVRFFYLVTLLAILEWFLTGKVSLLLREGEHAAFERYEGQQKFLVTVLAAAVGFTGFCYVLPRENREKLTTVCAVRSLLINEAQQYDEEMKERLALLENPATDGEDVCVPAFTVRPYLLFLYGLELTEDSSYWINETVANYYDKGSVTLVSEAQGE